VEVGIEMVGAGGGAGGGGALARAEMRFVPDRFDNKLPNDLDGGGGGGTTANSLGVGLVSF
jgi:hypothetical protein